MDLPPGPRWPGWLQAVATVRLPLFLDYCHRRYGSRFTVRMGKFGTYVYLTDPADIREVFHGDDDVLHAGEANAPFLGTVLGRLSVLCTDEGVHLRQRRQMSGPFHGEAVARLAPVMADVAAADVETWPVGETFAVLPHMRRVTLEVILRTVIGVAEKDEQRLARLRETLAAVADVDVDVVTMLSFPFPRLAKVGPWKRYAGHVRRADALLREEIERCRRAPDLAERPDVLATLVRETDMSTDELRDQLMTLLMAGHETTATALSWTLERLVRHPAVLARAQRAARQATPEGDAEYLDALINESLRNRPVVPDITRLSKKDVTIGTVDIPAGTFIDPAIYLVLRDAGTYPDPEVFRPERFLGRRPDPAAWLPFGGGSRRCLGAAFALTELRVVLSTVLRQVELATTSDRGERTRVRHVTLAPARGSRIRVLRRVPAVTPPIREPAPAEP